MSASYKLAYFNGKGLAEMSRLLLSATGTPFEDFRYPFQIIDGKYIKPEFEAVKSTMPMGQVPVLTVTDGANVFEIPQSKAIERYISKKTGLQGSSDEEAAQIDAVCELYNDIKTKFGAVKGDAEKVQAFFNETFPQLVAYLEKYIIKAGSGWIVGNKISQADVTLYHMVKFWFDASVNVSEKLPAVVNEVVAKVAAVPGIAAWEAGRAARAEVF